MSLEKIDTLIKALRYERYRWKPARRTYILKKNGKKRPLGMPTWSDKLVQEVLRLILESYFEPTFSEHSHGFSPGAWMPYRTQGDLLYLVGNNVVHRGRYFRMF